VPNDADGPPQPADDTIAATPHASATILTNVRFGDSRVRSSPDRIFGSKLMARASANKKNMAVEILRARSDAEFRHLSELLSRYEAELAPELRHGSVPSAAELETAYAKGGAAFLAMEGPRAIGCVAVTPLDTTTALMIRLFVKPEGRGAGAARALVAAAVRFLEESGFRRVVLDTDKQRLNAAYQLYRSMGFHECAPYGAVSYECPTFMERLLSRRSDLNR
jgi:GNAT superfamily N-acetyltransferase